MITPGHYDHSAKECHPCGTTTVHRRRAKSSDRFACIDCAGRDEQLMGSDEAAIRAWVQVASREAVVQGLLVLRRRVVSAEAALRAEAERLRTLLRRIETYAREDRARTPGFTRLARALDDARSLLAKEIDTNA